MSELKDLYEWFTRYSQSFYTTDQSVMTGVLHKEAHSIRVAKNAIDLAKNLHLDEHEQTIAEAIGLLHDISRYRQWTTFLSFNDATTQFDHGTIGAAELKKIGLLHTWFSTCDQETIYFAIYHHNKMTVPEGDPDTLLFAKLIRDADKLDIFRCLPPVQADHDYSPALISLLYKRAALPYSEVKTSGDKRLIRLGWLYDINFDWTLRHLVQEGYIEQLLNALPDTTLLNPVKQHFREYVAHRLP